MAVVFESFGSAQSHHELVAAQSGKVIRVLRALVVGWASVKVTLESDPGGTPSDLTAPLFTTAQKNIDLLMGRRFGVVTERGEALGMTSVYDGIPMTYAVMIWYEVVD